MCRCAVKKLLTPSLKGTFVQIFFIHQLETSTGSTDKQMEDKKD